MLDIHLAELYQVETRALKQAVRRNMDRFPEDFMFELTPEEIEEVVSQNVIPSRQHLGEQLPSHSPKPELQCCQAFSKVKELLR